MCVLYTTHFPKLISQKKPSDRRQKKNRIHLSLRNHFHMEWKNEQEIVC